MTADRRIFAWYFGLHTLYRIYVYLRGLSWNRVASIMQQVIVFSHSECMKLALSATTLS